MRIIAKLDIKNNFVIKGINMEGLRKVGDPLELAKQYYILGVDEISLVDCVASLYSRNNLFPVIERTTKEVFIPITLGGGIRSLNDIYQALRSGADKVSINTYATENPKFIKEAVNEFGSSTITICVEAKKLSNNKWEVYKNYGRDRTNIDLLDWLKNIQDLDCGEIHVTSIDYEGLQKGFDIELIESIYKFIYKPFVINGGCGSIKDIKFIKKNFENLSVAIASAFHYKKIELKELN